MDSEFRHPIHRSWGVDVLLLRLYSRFEQAAGWRHCCKGRLLIIERGDIGFLSLELLDYLLLNCNDPSLLVDHI